MCDSYTGSNDNKLTSVLDCAIRQISNSSHLDTFWIIFLQKKNSKKVTYYISDEE